MKKNHFLISKLKAIKSFSYIFKDIINEKKWIKNNKNRQVTSKKKTETGIWNIDEMCLIRYKTLPCKQKYTIYKFATWVGCLKFVYLLFLQHIIITNFK